MEEKEGTRKGFKAQSLIQTIYLCVVLLLLVGSLFLLSDLKGKLLYHYDGLNDHIYQHLKLKDYYLNGDGDGDFDRIGDGFYSQIELDALTKEKKWGIYSIFQLRTSKRSFQDQLDSFWKIKSKPSGIHVLRTIDKGVAIKYKGKVVLNGSLMIPEKSFSNNKLQAVVGSASQLKLNGSFVKAPMNLSKLKDQFVVPEVDEEFRFRESEINNKIITNSFKQPTIEITLESNLIEDFQISGNVIIKSSDIIKIANTAKMNNCLIVAPRIIVEKGFKGSVQILASEFIKIEDDVQLDSGTTIFLKTKGDKGMVSVSKNVSINGNIIVMDDVTQDITESFSN
ncbi:hypothetical protein [Nonlabens xylanidelens]|uniref:hypothetical protein n=1 Tax=Nonlabens xylanidelens TaxID=191564 RepID=UPI000CF3B16E|nr:hypothetical protein [Nonlabens xylanidelens]PQJ23593.1 hypothetical protein BST94_00080 [Nonlabens xylanidelens]